MRYLPTWLTATSGVKCHPSQLKGAQFPESPVSNSAAADSQAAFLNVVVEVVVVVSGASRLEMLDADDTLPARFVVAFSFP